MFELFIFSYKSIWYPYEDVYYRNLAKPYKFYCYHFALDGQLWANLFIEVGISTYNLKEIGTDI